MQADGRASLPPPPPVLPPPALPWEGPRPAEQQSEEQPHRVAWRRVVAFGLDLSLVATPAWLLRAVAGQPPSVALGVLVSLGYFLWFWTRPSGATPAMRLLRLRLASDLGGGAVSPSMALLRFVLLAPPALFLFLVTTVDILWSWVAFIWFVALAASTATSDRRQGLHDFGAGSQVSAVGTAGPARVGLAALLGLALWAGSVVVLALSR